MQTRGFVALKMALKWSNIIIYICKSVLLTNYVGEERVSHCTNKI